MKKNNSKFQSWWIIGLLVPFIGIIIYYCNKGINKETKSNLLTATWIGFGIWLFVALSFLISVNGPAKVEPKEYLISEWLIEAEKEEPVVTVMGLTTCGHCQQYKPVIEALAEEYGFKLYFFESDALSKDDRYILETTYQFEEYENSVPFTFIIKNGEVIDEETGYESKETTLSFLRNNGVIE